MEQDVQALIASASCRGRGARGSVGTLTTPEHHFTKTAHLSLERKGAYSPISVWREREHLAPSRGEREGAYSTIQEGATEEEAVKGEQGADLHCCSEAQYIRQETSVFIIYILYIYYSLREALLHTVPWRLL